MDIFKEVRRKMIVAISHNKFKVFQNVNTTFENKLFFNIVKSPVLINQLLINCFVLRGDNPINATSRCFKI